MTSGNELVNPFDITRTEYFNSQYSLIAEYFEQPAFYEDLVERERFFIIGSRGTGKSMILKSLYLPVYIESLKKRGIDPTEYKWKFVGVYVPCDNLNLQKYFNESYIEYLGEGDSYKGKLLWRRYLCNYLSLYVTREILSTIVTSGKYIGLDSVDNKNIITRVLNAYDPSMILKKQWPESLEGVISLFETEMRIFLDFVMEKIFKPDKSFDRPIVDLSFIKDVCNTLIVELEKLSGARFYILLDDFFPPFISFSQQAVFLDLIRERGGPLSFKITSVPEGITYTTDSGYEMRPDLDYNQKFMEYNNVGKGSEYWKLIREITNKRLAKYKIKYSTLLQETDQTIDDFLKRLRGLVSKGHDRPIYAGFDIIVEMSSGIAGTYLLLVREMVNFVLKTQDKSTLETEDFPIPFHVQDRVVRDRSRLSLGAILSLKNGHSIYRLVSIMSNKSRERLLQNPVAQEYIQFKIRDYEKLLEESRESHDILIVAFSNNILHSPDSNPTDRQKNVILKSLILNRLLTPALRIPYRDRWTVDTSADELKKILLADISQPMQITEEPPVSVIPQPVQYRFEESKTSPIVRNSACRIFAGSYCKKVSQLSEGEPGPFLSLPFKEDWHKVIEKLIKEKIDNTITSLDISPNGDFTCKICENIHKKEYGIYEISVLNDNVVFEMGLSLGLGKHTFVIWNKEEWTTTWGIADSPIGFLIGGFEGIPYFVKDEDINRIKDNIQKCLNKNSWNKDEIMAEVESEKTFLALPLKSEYYKEYLKKDALKAVQEIGINKDKIINLPVDFKEGLTLINTFRWILQSRICIIDSTLLPNYKDDVELIADYTWRMFSLGVAVGLRKPLIHCFNSNYTQAIASDIRGKCTFHYKDLELKDKLTHSLKEICSIEKIK